MEIINIPATNKTPKVILDPVKNYYEISGKCLPDNAIKFFDPILDWLDTFVLNPNKGTIFNVKMDYFNTSSSKLILEIFMKLEVAFKVDDSVSIKWFYSEGDDDMAEAGEDYSDIVSVPFSFESY